MAELAAEARRWRGEALLALGRREEGSEELARAALSKPGAKLDS
jgi:hypothetical protein